MTLLIAIVGLAAIYVMFTYNAFVKGRNQIKEAWSDIDVQLKRRYNLIPNIVETVKGYATHEQDTFTKITEARAKAINATNMQEHGAAENMLSGALKSLFAVAENYPELKANENFMQLQNELVDTEDKIQSSRRFYNGVVRDFNTSVEQFPSKVVAQMFQFKSADFFELQDAAEREVVKVDFNKKEASPAKSVEPSAAEKPPTQQTEMPLEGGEKKGQASGGV